MRRAAAAKREVLPDPKFGSRLIAKFVNIMMIRGKKSTAERIMYDALATMEDRAKQEAQKLFKAAIDNVKPTVEVKSRRVGDQRSLGGRSLTWHQLFSFFAPYRLRACLRFFTPCVSSEPRMIL